MARRSNRRRRTRSECIGSDQSDEDYTIDENECDESEDEYSSFIEDESEESIGAYEDEEEEEEMDMKKVKNAVRQRASKRKKNRALRRRKRKRVSYREDDVEDYDDDDEKDEDFKPDEIFGVDDDEAELPITIGNKKLGRTRLHNAISKGGDDDDTEYAPDEVDGTDAEEDELPMTNKKSGKLRLRKYIAKVEEEEEEEEEDDDNDGGGDDEFTIDEVDGADDEEDELPMTNKKSGKVRLRKCIAKVEEEEEEEEEEEVEEEDDDEDDGGGGDDDEFTIDEVDDTDDEEDELPMINSSKILRKRRLHKSIAKGEEDDTNDDEFKPDELPMINSSKILRKRRLHKSIAKGEEDDTNDDEFKPDELDEVDGVDEEEEFPMTSGNEQVKRGMPRGEDCDDDHDAGYYFTPDEVDDLDDEEDELPMMKGSRKLHRTCMDKGIAKGEQSNTASKALKKITRGKTSNKCGVKRKEEVNEDEKLNNISSEENNNTITIEGRRNKKLIVHSDWDSVNSGSLDIEYSISEEEREQVREANEFCDGLTASWRCPVIPKNLMERETAQLQKKRSRRKDKEKVEDWKPEAGKQVCGICLSEEGKRRVRGTLNCCNHYFCFACIMEWSKVESRCPLCKQRFVSISKPAKSNTCLDLRTVVIQVPECDQVYQPSEEELRGHLDPYENVICTECLQGGDDALMLLCDLCDSPAHTYCVGLGHEVPEGNWYCDGCRPTTLDSLNQQNFNLPLEDRTSNFSVGSPPVANVRETFDLNEMYIPETPLTHEACHVPSPRIGHAALPASGTAATVSDRRRIQRQIHLILNGRMRQADNRTTAVTGNYPSGSQIGQIRELSPQPVLTALQRAPHISFFNGRRLQDSIYGLPQTRNAFDAGSSHYSVQSIQNQPSTSVQQSFSGLSQGVLDVSSGLVHQQLHPCSSRPNIVPDASTSPYQLREVTGPSRTWHGGYTQQYR